MVTHIFSLKIPHLREMVVIDVRKVAIDVSFSNQIAWVHVRHFP